MIENRMYSERNSKFGTERSALAPSSRQPCALCGIPIDAPALWVNRDYEPGGNAARLTFI